jgi:hypothetical protein
MTQDEQTKLRGVMIALNNYALSIAVYGEQPDDSILNGFDTLRSMLEQKPSDPDKFSSLGEWCNIHGSFNGYPNCQGCATESQKKAFYESTLPLTSLQFTSFPNEVATHWMSLPTAPEQTNDNS